MPNNHTNLPKFVGQPITDNKQQSGESEWFMPDNLFNISGETIKAVGISIPVVGLLGYFGGKLVEAEFQRRRDDRQEFRTAYAKFAETFSFYLQQLETGETTLNILIVSEFPKHDLARRDFIRHLNKSRQREFNHKWLQYEEKYYQVKNLGVFGICAAIAPNVTELEKAKCSPEIMNKWEHDRSKELFKIVHDMLRIAEKKGWL